MVAVTNKGKILRRAANALLGDRVKMTSLTIEGGKIVAKTLGFAAKVATCCPSVEVTQTFALEGNVLEENELKQYNIRDMRSRIPHRPGDLNLWQRMAGAGD